ncbi:Condensin-2 complex subunit D3 [Chamberlinius hualienensis]
MAFNGIIDCLAKFETHNLDYQVVNEVFENDNIEEYQELNSALEDSNIKTILQQSIVEIRQLKTAGNVSHGSLAQQQNISEIENECELWTILVESGVNIKAIIVILNGLMKQVNKKSANFDEIENGITSASLYLSLLCFPGSNAFGLFQPYIYINVMDIFRFQGNLNGVTSTKTVSKQPHKRGRKPNSVDDNDNLDSQSENSDEIQLTFEESCSLSKQILQLGYDLQRFVSRFSLDNNGTSLDLTIERICLQIGKNSAINEGGINEFDTTTICLAILKTLCSEKHGEIKGTLLSIFKNIFDLILNASGRLIINFLCQLIDNLSSIDIFCAVRRLIQNLCCRSPERADFRAKVSSIVLVLLTRLPMSEYISVVKWFTKLLFHGKPGYRMIALEIIHLILGRPCVNQDVCSNRSQAYYASKVYLMKCVLESCSDKAPLVRAKALNLFGTCLTDSEPGVREVVCEMLSDSTATTDAVSDSSPKHQPGEECSQSESLLPDEVDVENVCRKDYVLKWKLIAPLIHKRIVDANVYVRKAAVQVLHNVFLTCRTCVTLEDISVLKSRCSDASVLVRKQALNALTSLLNQYPDLDVLHKEWLEGVMPVVLDNEPSCQEKSIEMIDDILLNNIKSGKFAETPSTCLVWKLLNLMTVSNERCHFDLCLKKSISLLSSAGRLESGIVAVLKGHIGTKNDSAAWMLLSMVIPCVKVKNLDFVWEYWKENEEMLLKETIPLMWIVQIMGTAITTLKEDQFNHYATVLKLLLQEGKCPLYVIPVLVDTIAKTDKRANKTGNKFLDTACKDLLKKCEDYLSSALLKKTTQSCDQDLGLISKYLITLGDVGQLCPKLISKNMISLLTSALVFNAAGRRGLLSDDPNRNMRSQECLSRLEILKTVPEIIYLSIGKLSICNDDMAKQCIATLSQQLSDSQALNIKRVIISIMGDFCVRYGTLVDRYLPLVLGCLKDPSCLVRKETVGVLASLLKEDYLRWRGPLYFCFVTTILDEDETIRKLSKYNLEHILRKRHPRIFSMHFIECLFFFNAYQAKKGKGQAQTQLQRDYKQFLISGSSGRKNRMNLYKFMIEHMVDDERILISGQLCNDILRQVIEGVVVLRKSNSEINSTSEELVRDALTILRSDEMRLSHQKSQEDLDDHSASGDGVNGPQFEGGAAAVAAHVDTVKKVVMTQMMKKNTLEIIVPVVLECKRKIEEQKSPLLKDIMLYLRYVMKHYKNEMKDMLAEDKNLAAEIEYDMKRLEKMENDDDDDENIEPPATTTRVSVQVPVTTIAAAVDLDLNQSSIVSSANDLPTAILNSVEDQTKSSSCIVKTTETELINNINIKEVAVHIEPINVSLKRHSGVFIRSPVVKIKRVKMTLTKTLNTGSSALMSSVTPVESSPVQSDSPTLSQSDEISPASDKDTDLSSTESDSVCIPTKGESPLPENISRHFRRKSPIPETTSVDTRRKSPVLNHDLPRLRTRSSSTTSLESIALSVSESVSTRTRGKSPVPVTASIGTRRKLPSPEQNSKVSKQSRLKSPVLNRLRARSPANTSVENSRLSDTESVSTRTRGKSPIPVNISEHFGGKSLSKSPVLNHGLNRLRARSPANASVESSSLSESESVSTRTRGKSPMLENISPVPETHFTGTRRKSPASEVNLKVAKQNTSKSPVSNHALTRLRTKLTITSPENISFRARSKSPLTADYTVQNDPSKTSRSKRKRRLRTVASTPVEIIDHDLSFGRVSLRLSPIPDIENTTIIENSLRVDDEKSHFIVNGNRDPVSPPPFKRRARPTLLFK